MKQIRPIPYYTRMDDTRMKKCAKALRDTLIPQIKRRLPMHNLSGLSHQAIVEYVAKWKKEYPYFFRSDILKYYPNINPIHLVTQAQIAYRDLFGLEYVPQTFNFFNKKVCHCIDDRHGYFSFLTHHKGKNT